MRAASPTFGYGDLDLVELDEQTPLQPARNQGRSSGSRLLPPVLACGCAALLRGARLSRPRLDGILTAFYESQDSESRECAVWVCVFSHRVFSEQICSGCDV